MSAPSSLDGLRVAIAGAGLAGLTLAHRLVAADADVVVHERDDGANARRQGFRITVDRHGQEALRACLSGRLVETLTAASGPPGGHFRFTDENLRDAFVLDFPKTPDAERQMDRQVVRRALLEDLGVRVRFGSPVTAVHGGDGTARPPRVEVRGQWEDADLVVVADGVGSTLRAAVFPVAAPTDTRRGAVYGRTLLQRDGHAVVPEALQDSGFLALLGHPGSAFFFTTMLFPDHPSAASHRSYVMWALVLTPDELEDARRDRGAGALARRVQDGVRGCHPLVQDLVAGADPCSLVLSRFSAGVRPGRAHASGVAVLGDAIHPMPPFGAHGGNTALRDAATLARHLDGLSDTSAAAVDTAVTEYHREMTGYAFEAVDAAMEQMARLGTDSRVRRWVLRRLLPRLHRRTLPSRT